MLSALRSMMSDSLLRALDAALDHIQSSEDPAGVVTKSLRQQLESFDLDAMVETLSTMAELGFDWTVHLPDVDGSVDVEVRTALTCLGLSYGATTSTGVALALGGELMPLFKIALLSIIGRAIIRGELDNVEPPLSLFGLVDDSHAVMSQFLHELGQRIGRHSVEAMYQRYVDYREEAEREVLSRLAGVEDAPVSVLDDIDSKTALSAALSLVRLGIIPRLIDIVRQAADRGSTVWLLGRDCDVLFVFLRRAGFANVKYLHGFNRDFVRNCSAVACEVARRLVKPGDVVVDTGFAGTCLAPFRLPGVTTVLVSSHFSAREEHLCLDAPVGDFDAEWEVRNAVLAIEHMSLGEEKRANKTRFVGGVPREVWDESMMPHHRAFASLFIQEAERHLASHSAVQTAA